MFGLPVNEPPKKNWIVDYDDVEHEFFWEEEPEHADFDQVGQAFVWGNEKGGLWIPEENVFVGCPGIPERTL